MKYFVQNTCLTILLHIIEIGNKIISTSPNFFQKRVQISFLFFHITFYPSEQNLSTNFHFSWAS